MSDFPYAPDGWSVSDAEAIAAREGINLTDDHWELIRALQEYYSKAEFPKLREITDALEERFHAKGGMKYLHMAIPAGPIAQGCRLAGLKVPAGSIDPSFGTAA